MKNEDKKLNILDVMETKEWVESGASENENNGQNMLIYKNYTFFTF